MEISERKYKMVKEDFENTKVNFPLVGKKAPSFNLKAFYNGEFKDVNLEDYLGKWLVLVFYPADFTFICPTELSKFADYYEDFKNENSEILSISKDTEFVHKAWWDNSDSIKKIKFPMLADPTGKMCKNYGTYMEEEGLSLRASIIIDPEGIVKSVDIHDNSIGRSVKEVLRKLKASKYVAENVGEVCPVDWVPGKESLKPGIELVGKI